MGFVDYLCLNIAICTPFILNALLSGFSLWAVHGARAGNDGSGVAVEATMWRWDCYNGLLKNFLTLEYPEYAYVLLADCIS